MPLPFQELHVDAIAHCASLCPRSPSSSSSPPAHACVSMSSATSLFRQRSVRPGLESLQRRAARLAASSSSAQLSRGDAAAGGGSTGAPKSDATRTLHCPPSLRPVPVCSARSDDGLHYCHRDRAVQAFGCGLTERPFHDRRRSHGCVRHSHRCSCDSSGRRAQMHVSDHQEVCKPLSAPLSPLAAAMTMLRAMCQWSAALACGAVKIDGVL